jgi:acyl-CoA thioesterase
VSTIKRSSATAELGEDGQSLRSLHTTFVAPVSHDAVDISVEVLRRGRSMSHLRAEVRNPAAARGHLTTAVFGSPRRGFEFTDLAPPAGFVPLELARSFRDPARGTGWTSLPSSRTGPSTRWP